MPELSPIDVVTHTVGPVVLRVTQPVLDWFREDNVAPTLAAAMIGGAIIILALFWLFKIVPTVHKLNKPIKFLRRLDRKMFAQKFDDFGAIMQRQRFLRHGWNEFVETLPKS